MPPLIPFITLSQVLAIILLVLTGYWTGKQLGGFAWDGSSLQFNIHPLLMVLGLIFLYGDAILMFRIFRKENKTVVKIMHFSLQIAAIVCGIVGLKAVFMFHNVSKIPNLYSAHSWLGLTAFILFLIQWTAGFVAFFFPRLNTDRRAQFLPIHRYFGVAIFCMACAAAYTGINEKLIFMGEYASRPPVAIVGNILAMSIVAFALCVGFIVTYPPFQRESELDTEKIPLAQAEMRHFSSTDDDQRVLEE